MTQQRSAASDGLEAIRQSGPGRRADDARFRHYFELGLVGMVTSSPDGTFLEINDRFCELLGYSQEELHGRTIAQVTHPDDRHADLTSLEAVRCGERDRWSVEKRYVHKDGRSVHAIVSNAAIRSDDGSIDHLVSIVADITAQKVAEQQLLRREEVFKTVVENTPDLIARFSRDLKRRYVNPAVERLTGRPGHELIGKTMSELNFDERFSDRIEEALKAVFASGTETTLDVLLPSASGERVFQARIVPEIGPTEEVDFALVISRDITSIRRDQERLQALSEEIELLLASTYEGILAADQSGICTLVNRSAASMLGYTAEEMMGRSLHELTHDRRADGSPCSPEDCPIVNAVKPRKPALVANETLRRKDGSSFPVDIFISPILSDENAIRGMVASFIDITERKNLLSELENAKRLAGLGRVATAMSHEFNNVLMGIQPFAELVLRSSKEPRVTAAANRIIQSVQRGRDITEDLRAFTHPLPPVRTPVNISSWLSERGRELDLLLPANVELRVEIEDTSMTVDADPDQIMLVLTVAVHNAREALGPRGGSIRLTAGLSGDDESRVHLAVIDDGPGIGAADLSRIFEPFFTTKASGTGLGLPIAHQIVTLHGGELSMDSEPGKGTTMHIFLPATAKPVQPAKEQTAPAPHRWPREVLLVEDDEAVAIGVVTLLEDENVKVRLAPDGATAMKILESYRPQALVIDINLPDCNGFDLYEQITASSGPLPVVFASGHADASRLQKLSSSAGARLLTKPYAIDTLLETLEALQG